MRYVIGVVDSEQRVGFSHEGGHSVGTDREPDRRPA